MTTDRELARWRPRSQHLVSPHADSAATVVRSLLAVQAENPSQAAWAVACRTRRPDATELEDLLDRGLVVRTHVLRPTWHFAAADDVGWLLELTAPRVRPVIARQLEVLGLVGRNLDRATSVVLDALAAQPDQTREQLADHLRAAGAEPDGPRLMLLLALLELALRYFAGHGPATDRDLAYWATLTLGDVRRGLAEVRDRLTSFEHDGRTYWHAPGEEAPTDRLEPAGHLLQTLDETYRGYQDSRMVLDSDAVVPSGRDTAIGMALVDAQMVARMKCTLGRRVVFEITPDKGGSAARCSGRGGGGGRAVRSLPRPGAGAGCQRVTRRRMVGSGRMSP